jgi:RNA polymerase sigma-70 factor (ECF subfamily)
MTKGWWSRVEVVGLTQETARRPALQHPTDITAVFDRYFDSVYRFLYSRVGNREDAEDLASEVFLKASRLLDNRRAEASIADWLFTVSRTVLADHWRRYYRSGGLLPLDEERAAEIPEVVTHTTSDKTEALVNDVLQALPERYRRVLELRFLLGYSIRETAQEIGVTEANAKVLQHRALAKAVQLGRLPT